MKKYKVKIITKLKKENIFVKAINKKEAIKSVEEILNNCEYFKERYVGYTLSIKRVINF